MPAQNTHIYLLNLRSLTFPGSRKVRLVFTSLQHWNIEPILRPRRLSSRGSGFLLTKNRADQPRLSNVVQLRGVLPRVENGNKY